MAPTLESLGIDKLSLDDRVELAHAILESVDREVENTPLTDAQVREVERRLAEHAADPGSAIPWEEIEARLLAKVRK